ncbi:MAG: AAA family ATPase [Hymenobacteraceae bacterium]|nr:AAA family ATPase [Hymenobacteraceae bacterium]
MYLKKKPPELLEELLTELRRRVPRLESITAEETIDKRLVLRLKDEAFAEPIPVRFASDGPLRRLAYLVVLNEPEPAGLLGVEEPEAEIHPARHYRLAENFIRVSARTQIFVATHSPQFLNALEPEQVWVLDRTADGYIRATRAADISRVKNMMDHGAQLGELWLEGYLDPDARRPAADAR